MTYDIQKPEDLSALSQLLREAWEPRKVLEEDFDWNDTAMVRDMLDDIQWHIGVQLKSGFRWGQPTEWKTDGGSAPVINVVYHLIDKNKKWGRRMCRDGFIISIQGSEPVPSRVVKTTV